MYTHSINSRARTQNFFFKLTENTSLTKNPFQIENVLKIDRAF